MVNTNRRSVIARDTGSDLVFTVVNYTLLGLALLAVAYPLYFVLIASVSDPNLVNTGQVVLFPRGITWEGYRRVFSDPLIWSGYRNTVIYAGLGTFINLLLTIPSAYALSRRDLRGRGAVMVMVAFAMLFSGGMIPRYLVIRDLGLINTIWAMVLPAAVLPWFLIIARTFFQETIPDELLDAAVIDGSSNVRFFVSIVVPLSPALVAVLLLFYGVAHWNAFFDALLFLRSQDRYPLQLVLRDILVTTQLQAGSLDDAESMAEKMRIAETMKYGAIIVSSVPVLALYPFLQKYFVKGVMIGALKG